MHFLDYAHLYDWAQIMVDSVRSTEGITQRARLCVQALDAELVQSDEEIMTFCVRARIQPIYAEGQLFMRYDTGRRIFERLPVFEGSARAISKVTMTFQGIVRPKTESATFQAFADALLRQMSWAPLLLERSFQVPPSGSLFRITSHDLLDPVFTEPDTGTVAPLWFVGGVLSEMASLPNEAGREEGEDRPIQLGVPTLGVEPLFAFPNVDAQHPFKANVELWRESTLMRKDPHFTKGESSIFSCFPKEVQPWTLAEVVEAGAIVLDLFEGRFVSKQLLKGDGHETAGEDVWVVFEKTKEKI